jgi:organizing structure protein 2
MTKRHFYEDDAFVVTKPGVNSEITSELEQKETNHGNISYVKGMTVRSTPYLEEYSNKLRLWLYDRLSVYEAELGTQKSSFCNEVKTVQNGINSTIADPVLPNLIYILTATLSGSVLVGRRGFVLRSLTPLAFGTAATAYFAPNTFNNITSNYEAWELQKFPEFNQQKHEIIIKNYNYCKSTFNNSISTANAQLQSSIHDSRVKLAEIFKKD